MSPMQIAAIALMFSVPVALALLRPRSPTPAYDRAICRTLAVLLLVIEAGEYAFLAYEGRLTAPQSLPCQLCHWALYAMVYALWFQRQWAFELCYFWGLAGTLQALFTPALTPDLAWWRQFGFFFIHAGIVAGVLYLLLGPRYRPRPASLWRVAIWSEIYFLCAYVVNNLTGSNYGFIARKPGHGTLLDALSDDRFLYSLQIHAIGYTAFALLYLPWLLRDLLVRRPA